MGLVLRIDHGEFHLGFCDRRSGLVVLDRQACSHRQLAALLAARADAHKAVRAASAAVVRVVLMLPRLALGNFRARWIGGGEVALLGTCMNDSIQQTYLRMRMNE